MPKKYIPTEKEKYMCEKHKTYFKKRLTDWKNEIIESNSKGLYLNEVDNEISSPFLEEDRSGLKKYKILKVTNRYDEHKANYSRDYTKIKDLALKEKQVSRIKEWMDEKIESTYININTDYKNCNFKNKWIEK